MSGGVHDGRHIDSGSLAGEAPEQTRDESEQSLEEQDQRHPLVVADHLTVLLLRELLAGDGLLHRQVVGVRDPADRVGVVTMRIGELCRAPAVHRPTDELLRTDEEPEADEDDESVLPTESVDVVIVHTELDLSDAENGLEETIHGCWSMW